MNPWSAIAAATAKEYRRLFQGLNAAETAQRHQLKALLRANSRTEFGRYFSFAEIRDTDQYRAAVPVHTYEDLASYTDRFEANGLLGEPIVLYEETSGSSGKAKIVPYTERSLRGFRRAVHPWLHDLSQHYPRLGPAYFAVSPVGPSRRLAANGTPIGAESDAIYFGRKLRKPLEAISIVPDSLATPNDMRQWQYLTLLYLLRNELLTLISIWSPTFITALLADLPQYAENLLRDLHDGAPAPMPGASPVAANPDRAAVVATALAGKHLDTQMLWPQLQFISTWSHASASRFVPELRRLFPKPAIQGKGLLATEGVVSLPLSGHEYPVLAVNSGFYEFFDNAERSHLAHELVVGQDYEVVLSVPGFYRYRNGDRVRVHGRVGTAPQLEFIGRSGLVSDLVGEKLTESFAAECLRGVEGFAMLAPALEPQPHYQLFVESADTNLQKRMEQALRENPQYTYARDLRQLGPLKTFIVSKPMPRYLRWALGKGQRLGDIKPPSLRPETDWRLRMCGLDSGTNNMRTGRE